MTQVLTRVWLALNTSRDRSSTFLMRGRAGREGSFSGIEGGFWRAGDSHRKSTAQTQQPSERKSERAAIKRRPTAVLWNVEIRSSSGTEQSYIRREGLPAGKQESNAAQVFDGQSVCGWSSGDQMAWTTALTTGEERCDDNRKVDWTGVLKNISLFQSPVTCSRRKYHGFRVYTF